MLRNYLVTALRNLKRNRVYTILNIFGLALGIGCALVIFKVIQFDYSFDKDQTHYHEIYRVVNQSKYPDRTEKGMGTPHPLGPALKTDFAEVQVVTRVNFNEEAQLNTYDGVGQLNKFLEKGVAFADSTYFDVFSVNWIAGNQQTALTQKQTVVISKSVAQRLFSLPEGMEGQALGKLINYGNVKDFTVVGVMDDPSEATSLPFHYLFDYMSQDDDEINPYFRKGSNWNSTSSNTNTYFIPMEGFDQVSFEKSLVPFVEKYRGEGMSEKVSYHAQAFKDIHFQGEYSAFTQPASKTFLLALAIIGAFLVITACINFVNLATAQAANRAKEIGIRKAIGGMTNQLVIQFLAEIAIITLFSLVLALAIAELMFGFLTEIIGTQLSVNLLGSPETIGFLMILFIGVSFLSGFYPAVLLSRMNTVAALKRKITAGRHSGGLSLRKGLVTLQFSITQFLIIGTLIVSSQTYYFLNKDLGFETEAIMSSYLPERDVTKMERMRQLLVQSPAIESVTYSMSEPTGNSNSKSGFNYTAFNTNQPYHANFKVVDEYYTDLFGLNMLAGRSIQKGDSNNIVVNKKIADLMGFTDRYEEVVGETLATGWNGDKKIVGVVDNFHTYNLEEDLDYIIMIYFPQQCFNINYKATSLLAVEEANAHFEEVWNTVFPEYVLDYDFYAHKIAEEYEGVKKITSLMKLFAVISILIGCLGLYGLIAFIAMNKTKEIGVRKVLGASTMHIVGIFSKEIIVLMIVAFVVTAPVAFYFLQQWLQTFAYSIEIGPGFFLLAFLVTLIIAMITISYKTISTALINPAETLHDD